MRNATIIEDRSSVGWIVVLCGAVLAGCASAPPRNAVPEELADAALIAGIPEARFAGDEPPPYIEEWLGADTEEEMRARFAGVMDIEHHYLAISGGGANGAYAAGLLVGWSEEGSRPTFTIVTGISTGALAAPFAFLGSEYDDELREIYTTFDTEDLVESRGIFALFRQDALEDSAPLRAMIARYVDENMIAELAAEHASGRALLVGTTNIDSMRPIIWNLTRIAASDAPQRTELIRDILLASASIPVGLPPVLFEVEANGQMYDEMHVDGGATSQVFFYPIGLDWESVLDRLNVPGQPDLYVIRNARIEPTHEIIERRSTDIGFRTIESLLRTQGLGDLYRIYLAAELDGLEYHGAAIPEDFTETSAEFFDPVYMQKLFDLGFELARDGYPWSERPPGM